ncbi:hypothetical protein F0562_024762 [Nyssa sinensis]|uniref:Malectin-like domain-containing protein n=1 Tax=Nyssa sinensis TaxID=561372 RepID=A0A5J5BC70_9ASTE|nr:hypothetical protein F0562_024762 [Nyssa sinensis]
MTDVSDYNDATTNILYTSDAKFINTGTDGNISSIYSNTVQRPLSTVRSFSHGDKNCYTLVPEQGKNNKYLIRASFMYGNYDSKDQLPVFKLYLGVEEWDVVKFNNNFDIVFKEIIHIPSTDYINVCLVNNGSGTPFISALELRQLNNSIYKTQSGSLMLYRRYDVGSTTNQIIRYEDDVYDRIWKPFSWTYWVPISASYTSDLLSANEYKPPPTVMTNGTPFLKFYWLPNDPSQQFYVYLHFAEVQDLGSDQLRKFDIFLNGDPLD